MICYITNFSASILSNPRIPPGSAALRSSTDMNTEANRPVCLNYALTENLHINWKPLLTLHVTKTTQHVVTFLL